MAGKNEDHTKLILGMGALAIAYFGIIKPITDKLSLTKSAGQRATEELNQLAETSPGWNPGLYKEYRSATPYRILTDATAKAQAKKIHKAWSVWFENDKQAIYTAFRFFKCQLWLSQVVDQYAALYNADLLTRLRMPSVAFGDRGLDDKSFSAIANMVVKLPLTVN